MSTSGGTVATLAERLGLSAESATLLTALTHGSYANDHQVPSNEQLEFLGDAVVQLAATTLLLATHPGLTEGQGSQARQWLVSERALAEVAHAWTLADSLRLGKSLRQEGVVRSSVLADAVEAVVAAVFVDRGYDAAVGVVHDALREKVAHAVAAAGASDPKGQLAQWAHQRGLGVPSYVVRTSGSGHDPSFTADVVLGGRVLATAEDRSKKRAELAAARAAWEGRDDAGDS